MKTDLLACRHIGVNKADAEVMLRKIGVASLDELCLLYTSPSPRDCS